MDLFVETVTRKEDEMVFFFQAEDGIRDLTVTGVQTCALPICSAAGLRKSYSLRIMRRPPRSFEKIWIRSAFVPDSLCSPSMFFAASICWHPTRREDRKSTRLNSSHSQISYAVFCLKKKKITQR